MNCRLSDFLLFQQLRRPDAPPFLGLLSLTDKARDEAIERVRTFLAGRSAAIPHLFQAHGYLAGWAVTQALSDNYGGDDLRVYAPISEALGVPLDTTLARDYLHSSFLALCERLGLPSRGLDRKVDLYLLHAGVPRGHVQQLIGAFIRQHEHFGSPPVESTMLLNRWEDESLDFLEHTVVTPRRAILWDETAWHARLYSRIALNPEGFVPGTPFEKFFADCFAQARVDRSRGGRSVSTPPRPRLMWGPDGLALRLPRANGRIAVQFGDAARPLRLKGGEDWPVEQPWPRRIAGQIDGNAFALEFLADESRVAIFDMTIGQFLAEKQPAGSRDVLLDTSDALVAARRPFKLAGEDAIPLGDGCFVQRVVLDHRPIELSVGTHRLALATRPRRRLSLTGDEIAFGQQGQLFGPRTKVRLETGLPVSEARRVQVTLAGSSTIMELSVHDGAAECPLLDCLPSDLSTGPTRVRLELLAPERDARATGIAFEAFVWPGFEGVDGLVFSSNTAPANFLKDQSSYVAPIDGGLQLDPKGGFNYASAAFGIDGEVVSFRLPWPDIALTRHRMDGTTSPVVTGARISVGEEDRYGHVSIRCPDRGASLRVGNRQESRPFALGMTRNISISDLVGQGQNATVVLRRSNGAEVLLFEVVDALQPSQFELRSSREGLHVSIKLLSAIDAVAIETEDEMGRRDFNEIALGRRPTRRAAPDWVAVNRLRSDPREVSFTIAQRPAVDGLVIGRIFVRPDSVRPDESWRPLRNARGDTYALPLTTPHSLDQAPADYVQTRFETISRWLSDCYSVESWQNQGLERSLPQRWRALGQIIAQLPMGAGLLIRASLLAAPDETATSWLPLVHPVELDPELYSYAPSSFTSLGDRTEAGLRAGSRLAAFSTERLRDGLLHAQALMAFQNSVAAQTSGEQLVGFSPERFFRLFGPLDTDPAAGWFWHGTPLLGPAHLRSAHLAMLERFQAAKVFYEIGEDGGGNSRRAETLTVLARHIWKRGGPCPMPPMPKRLADDERPSETDLAIAAALSEFARVSRAGTTVRFVEELAQELQWRNSDVLASFGFLLRLAPELFFYFLLIWQLAKVRP